MLTHEALCTAKLWPVAKSQVSSASHLLPGLVADALAASGLAAGTVLDLASGGGTGGSGVAG